MSKRDYNEIMGIQDDSDDAKQNQQEMNSGCGEVGKWILITLFIVCGASSANAPVVGLIFWVILLLTYTGSEHKGGNDAKK